MQFVVEGKAYWAFAYKSCELAQENYQLMLAPDAETVVKFEKLDQCAIAIAIAIANANANAHNLVY